MQKEEGDLVVAMRSVSRKKSSRDNNPRVVAVTKLDKEVRVVPDPPPPLRVKELDSPQFTESVR